jgi:hypothetical protein
MLVSSVIECWLYKPFKTDFGRLPEKGCNHHGKPLRRTSRQNGAATGLQTCFFNKLIFLTHQKWAKVLGHPAYSMPPS